MSRAKLFTAFLTAGLAFAASCSKEPEQKPLPQKELAAKTETPPAAASGTGTIVGKVVFKGDHKPEKLAVGKDKDVCGTDKQDPSLLIGKDGGVKNAVVQIAGLKQGKTPEKEAVLDQVKCEYVPHVLVMPAGATVTIKNSDGILHNVHTLSKINSPFNRAQPKFVKELKETLAKPEIVPVRCDVHGWMSGWIVVTDNVYFEVTQADGVFKLTDVPAGKHSLEVWHEVLGKTSQDIDVKAGETATATFELQLKK